MNDDRQAVAALLGRDPQAGFDVVVRSEHGQPIVIRNEPLLDDGTPMPTRYWLVDPELRRRIGGLESSGRVRRAESEVDPDACWSPRTPATPPSVMLGSRPITGTEVVGWRRGTRRGVKCLHAHSCLGSWPVAMIRSVHGLTPSSAADSLRPEETDL